MLDSKIPAGALANKWSDYKSKVPLVSPANKLNLDVIIIGTVSYTHLTLPTIYSV